MRLCLNKKECWHWPKSKTSDGYGQLHFNGKKHYAHRFFYESIVGKIPKDKEIDHLCRERDCFNPKHLELVSSRENSLRGNGIPAINAQKDKCIRGHLFTEENTYRPPYRKNSRLCLECRKVNYRRWKEAQ